jgi:hypothetical protein
VTWHQRKESAKTGGLSVYLINLGAINELMTSDSDQRPCLTLSGETYIRRSNWMVPIFRFMMVVVGGVRKGLRIQMDMIAATLGVEAKYER